MFFFIIPVGVDYQARRYPVVTFTLMGICTLIYLVTRISALFNGSDVDLWSMSHLWLIPAYSPWWTHITSLFVHAGLFHLAGNMIYLFLFGSCVEDIIGRFHFLMFYLLCGFGATFTQIAFTPDHFGSMIPMCGASEPV